MIVQEDIDSMQIPPMCPTKFKAAKFFEIIALTLKNTPAVVGNGNQLGIHAVTLLLSLSVSTTLKDNSQLYAKSFYTLNSFKKTYSMPIIHPHSNENIGPLNSIVPPLEVGPNDHWDSESNSDESDHDRRPPIFRRQAGRPPKQRSNAEKRREVRRGEIRRVQKCGLCREVGHSARTCKGPLPLALY
jgi:hypothetical protein